MRRSPEDTDEERSVSYASTANGGGHMHKVQEITGGTYTAHLSANGSDVTRIAEFGSMEDARNWARNAGDSADVCLIEEGGDMMACVMRRHIYPDGRWEWIVETA